jgi:oligo-1,6-glucosidase/glucan 1,6-alpha-glucosidase
MDDNGYDISNYDEIDPIFGNMDDMNLLIEEVHQKGMKIIMDLVINHTSDEHVWFLDAKKSKTSPYRHYYIWQDEIDDTQSIFGGSAWTKDDISNQYYFHLFSKKQPDLNWHYKPLREAIYQMINRWLDKGIDGFRLDVIDLIGKDVNRKIYADGPYLNQYLSELYERCFKGRDIMTVGEMPGLSIERAAQITSGEYPLLSMVFQFAHIGLDEQPGLGKWHLKKLDLIEFKETFERLQKAMYQKGWNSLFLSNHDQPRVVTRYGSEIYRYESSKMLATILYGMQGTPYIYQGEEIGMTGIKLLIDEYKDIETKQIYDILKKQNWSEDDIMTSIYAKSRDNSRTPFQWDDTMYAGFSKHQPWLKINPNYKMINVKHDINHPKSIFQYYKKLISIRKNNRVFKDGAFELVARNNSEIMMYLRKNEDDAVLVIGSFVDKTRTIDLKAFDLKEILISNDETIALAPVMTILPYYCAIIRVEHICQP